MSNLLNLINPKTIIKPNNLNNIMTDIANQIILQIQQNYNLNDPIIYTTNIQKLNKIMNIYLKIYKFFQFGINQINIQIYNGDRKSVV